MYRENDLVPTVTVLCTHNFTCMIVRAKPFYAHENQYTQILNLSSPGQVEVVVKYEHKGPLHRKLFYGGGMGKNVGHHSWLMVKNLKLHWLKDSKSKVRIIFSEVIRENLLTNSSSQGVWGSVVPKDFSQNAIQMQEYNIQFNCHTYYLH